MCWIASIVFVPSVYLGPIPDSGTVEYPCDERTENRSNETPTRSPSLHSDFSQYRSLITLFHFHTPLPITDGQLHPLRKQPNHHVLVKGLLSRPARFPSCERPEYVLYIIIN